MCAHAAISILNATLCGTGASLAITGGVVASRIDGQPRMEGAPDQRLWDALANPPHAIRMDSTFGPSRGLKTSSGAAWALLDAVGQATVADAVALCKQAGVTLTGAWDDQWAVARGGLHVINANGEHHEAWDAPPWHVAVWVPEATIAKQDVPRDVPEPLRIAANDAAQMLRDEGPSAAPHVMNEVSPRLIAWYAGHGLPVTNRPAEVARAAGAHGAGLSGTGPAVAALFDAPRALPGVPGGTWQWQQTVPLGGGRA